MTVETIEELAKRRSQIAKYSTQDLEMMTVTALKKLAVNIVPNHSKMRKNELVEALIAATKPERTIAIIIPDTSLEIVELNQRITKEISENTNEDLAEWTSNLYKEFRALVQSKWKMDGTWDESIYGDIAGFAYRVMRFLDTREGESNGKLAMTTKLRYRTHICNLLNELVNAEEGAVYHKQIESCLQILLRQIKIQISDLTQQKKGLQDRRLAERKKEKATVDFNPIHEFAVNVLTRLDKLKAPDWKKVSIALAIVTGRRMAEIHQKSTEFEYVDEWTCRFKGQLKVKGDALEYFNENPYYEIPVLVDARLVVQAHQWLKNYQKVVDTPEAANKRYSADLSDAMKVLRSRLGVNHEFFTYKGLRTIYAQVCSQVFNNNDPDNTLYLAQILGHGRGELLRGDNLIDMLTPQSYNSDFRVVNVDCVLDGVDSLEGEKVAKFTL